MDFDFSKYQALGNDYIVIDPRCKWFSPEIEKIKKICDRNFGVGSDGILYGPFWVDGLPGLRIFNPDGSEAEKSGNGLRIFAHHLYRTGQIQKKEFIIKTRSGLVDASIENEDASLVTINMGKASFKPEDIALNSPNEWVNIPIKTDKGEFKFTCLSIGNPHAVFFPERWDEELIYEIGPIIENHKLFLNRTNVQMVRVLDNSTIEIRIWERGAGFTQASGSSSCAAAYVSHYLKKISNNIVVKMPGGDINISVYKDGDIFMRGYVQHVYDGINNSF